MSKMKRIIPHFSPPSYTEVEIDASWRSVSWREYRQKLLTELKEFQPGNSEVDTLRILLHGPVGAGKSSFINSVNSCVQDRITCQALPAITQAERSFTAECKTYKLKKDRRGCFYPFTFIDIMGIEGNRGIQTGDIIKILGGHIRDDYTFNPAECISEENPKYIKKPRLKDEIHCLVSVLPANIISMVDEEVVQKMKEVREGARQLGFPQVVVLTKVDETCQRVKNKPQKIYRSKKIKEKMEECSVRLGVPVSYIYPVKNYHEEHHTNTTMDTMILRALQSIVNLANDYVERKENSE